MGWFKRKKYKCLICNKRIGDNSAIVKYKYGPEGASEIGEARLCNKCAKSFEKTDMEETFNEPF